MSFNIKNTDSFQKGVLSTGGGGGGIELPDPDNANEYVVWNNDSKEWVVGGAGVVALGANASGLGFLSTSIGIDSSANVSSVAIGVNTISNVLDNGVAIGKNINSTAGEAVILNGSGEQLNVSVSGFFVKPISSVDGSPPTIVYDNSTGEVGYVTSSIRYKENLEPIQGYKDLLNIEPYLFKYKDSEVTDTGLIAEHIDEYPSLRKLVYYKDYNETDEDGNAVAETKPEGVHYQKIGVFNLKLIKDLYEQDKVLTDRLKNIEEKLQ